MAVVMSAPHALEAVRAIQAAGVVASIEGGWGVDALIGRQTREHSDLDLALGRDDCDAAASALAVLGYRHDPTDRPGLPARFVLKNEDSLQVDLHPLVFDAGGNGWQQLDEGGNGWQQLDEGGWYLNEVRYLWRDGHIVGNSVCCIAAELQLAFRLGHPLSAKDAHDLSLLADHFGTPLPPE